ncbi:MAG: 50S ribosomal protein L21 [Nitrospirae bacterium GWC2_57_13]|nr:MAG: 50S ribosomal protein L21 [Nitrospirae bacterium GWC2_57_13]HAR46222.1 50S ribosomal protein L21 [Nitrospiraceae bacterium]
MNVYAVIYTGGKQYRVSPGDIVQVEKLDAEPGATIEITDVYLVAAEGRITAGRPKVDDARVVAQVLDQNRDKKIIVFKKNRRKGYRKTLGHRQYYTELKVTEIVFGSAVYRELPKESLPSKEHAVAPAKAAIPKERTKPKKKPAMVPPTSQQPESPPPAQATIAAGIALAAPSPMPERTLPEAQAIPPTPARVPEKPQPVAKPAAGAVPQPMVQQKKPSSDRRIPWWIIGAIIAALALLSLLFFTKREKTAPAPGPEVREKTAKPKPEMQKKAAPVVRDVKTRETAPVDKPATPAQPPD